MRLSTLALTISLSAACTGAAPSPSPSPSLPPSPSPDPTSGPALASSPASPPSAPSAPAAPLTLIVGGDDGLHEVGLDGAVKRAISRSPARRPRLAAGGKEVVFYARAAGEIRRVSLADGAEARVVTLPRAFPLCAKTGRRSVAAADLDVQEDGDFVVSAGKVCLTLMDRNANMASVRIEARVDLASGALQHRVAIGGACGTKAPALPACAAPDAAAPPVAPAFPLASIGLPASAGEESVSPSGRWSVLSQQTDAGDYIHRSLFLLDRRDRRVHPIAPGAFPEALDAAQLASLRTFSGTADAVGESDVRWLGGRDVLLVDRLLVIPEQRGVELRGQVAR